MRILMLTAGSRGDVQPYVSLGKGLKKAGYQVCLASFPGFKTLASRHGLEFFSVTPPTKVLTKSDAWQRWQCSGRRFPDFIYYFYRVARQAQRTIEAMINDFWIASQEADLILSSSSGIGGPLIARALRVPHCWALFQPHTKTTEFPHFLTPSGLRFGRGWNLWTYRFAIKIFWLLFRRPLDNWRRNTLELSYPTTQDLDTIFDSPFSPTIYGFSEKVLPKPQDWKENIHICGFWFLDHWREWEPEDELVRFLEAGQSPFYFGLANIHFKSQIKLINIILKALNQTGQRGILYAPGLDLNHSDISSTAVYVVDDVPHDWLFPQLMGIVHHGGAGTTASALRAGISSVGIPGFYDQPFWSERIARLGMGPEPLPLWRLEVDALANAIQRMSSDSSMQTRTSRLGQSIGEEDGVLNAVEVIQKIIATSSPNR